MELQVGTHLNKFITNKEQERGKGRKEKGRERMEMNMGENEQLRLRGSRSFEGKEVQSIQEQPLLRDTSIIIGG